MNEWIVSDPEHLGGNRRVRGTRISVAFILESLAAGMSVAENVEAYPSLTEESVKVFWLNSPLPIWNVKQAGPSGSFRLVRVIIQQQRQDDFVREFVEAFRATEWKAVRHCADWPSQ